MKLIQLHRASIETKKNQQQTKTWRDGERAIVDFSSEVDFSRSDVEEEKRVEKHFQLLNSSRSVNNSNSKALQSERRDIHVRSVL